MNRVSKYMLAGLLLIALIVYVIYRQNKKDIANASLISTQSESNERIKELGLDKFSEDASYILDKSKLSLPDLKKQIENDDYKADPEREWIIDLVQVNGGEFREKDLRKIFDKEWRSQFPTTIYGFSPVENKWNYVEVGEAHDIYSKVQVGVDVLELYNDEELHFSDSAKLGWFLTELEERIKDYPTKLRAEPSETIENAITKAQNLVNLIHEFDREAVIILQSDRGYKGLEVWDVLQSVGLTWGDGDLFHWNNGSGYGDEQYFSVTTITAPGYFLPEDIEQGTMNPENLVFSFSIARSADPKNIFEIMLNAARYCQKRLGGQILDRNRLPIDEEKEKRETDELISKMRSNEIIPGSEKALRIF